MSLDHSVQGAKHQSFRKDNPRDLLDRTALDEQQTEAER
jgi:hypothetical protein